MKSRMSYSWKESLPLTVTQGLLLEHFSSILFFVAFYLNTKVLLKVLVLCYSVKVLHNELCMYVCMICSKFQ